MIDIDLLIAQAKENEPRVLYESYKATGSNITIWDTVTFNGGGHAKAVVEDKTITLYYTDGTTATYTEA